MIWIGFLGVALLFLAWYLTPNEKGAGDSGYRWWRRPMAPPKPGDAEVKAELVEQLRKLPKDGWRCMVKAYPPGRKLPIRQGDRETVTYWTTTPGGRMARVVREISVDADEIRTVCKLQIDAQGFLHEAVSRTDYVWEDHLAPKNNGKASALFAGLDFDRATKAYAEQREEVDKLLLGRDTENVVTLAADDSWRPKRRTLT